ncbi:TetR/AcrR family transcriptional regulator [Streptomyces sp. NPDC052236]|uniref:TetR/AcrR family transcriptional regulator n=1 Tax=Streptomyces sp. NPDC052236 TaxID=3365686 RepID=UPI0037D8BCA9
MAVEPSRNPGKKGPRERFRAQVREEAKAVAERQLAEGGPEALSLNAIAKELGMTGPGLYRYFANRDTLLTELVIDAYRDLSTALAVPLAGSQGSPGGAPDRLSAVTSAYRAWAVAEPHRYRLLFRAPLPGYDAHSPDLVEAARRAMDLLLGVMNDLMSKREAGGDPAAEAASLAILLWARLHGLVSLEIEGNFDSMSVDPAPLYELEVTDIVRRAQEPR